MRSNIHAVDLAKSLLDYCGIEAEGFEETNKALISLDYETSIIIVVEDGLIHLISPLGPARPSESLFRRLLQENFRSLVKPEYRYAIEPESGELMMARTLPPNDALTADGLIKAFLAMVEFSERWSRSLAGGSAEVQRPDPAGSEPAAEAGERTESPASVDSNLQRV